MCLHELKEFLVCGLFTRVVGHPEFCGINATNRFVICVYDAGFLFRVGALVFDKDHTVVVIEIYFNAYTLVVIYRADMFYDVNQLV